jgi:hypothetical protein
MGQQTRSTLKGWFLRKMEPLQQQFHDWIDSFWHKEDDIPMERIEGLGDALEGLASAAEVQAYLQGTRIAYQATDEIIYQLPAGHILEKILIKPSSPIMVRIGKTATADDLVFDTEVGMAGEVFILNVYSGQLPQLHVKGIVYPASIIYYLRKVSGD